MIPLLENNHLVIYHIDTKSHFSPYPTTYNNKRLKYSKRGYIYSIKCSPSPTSDFRILGV